MQTDQQETKTTMTPRKTLSFEGTQQQEESEIIRLRRLFDQICTTPMVNNKRILKELNDQIENDLEKSIRDDDLDILGNVAVPPAEEPPEPPADNKESRKPLSTFINKFNPLTEKHPMIWLDRAIQTTKRCGYSNERIPYGLVTLMEGKAMTELQENTF